MENNQEVAKQEVVNQNVEYIGAVSTVDTSDENVEEVVEKEKVIKVLCKRKAVGNKVYHDFYSDVEIFGEHLRITYAVNQNDVNAYNTLRLIFAGKDEIDMNLSVVRRTNGSTGRITKSLVCTVSRTNENGFSLSYNLRPNAASDRSHLEFYAKAELGLEF